jgi:hypothetical protein
VGNTVDQIAVVWPEVHEFGFANEMDKFELQLGTVWVSACGAVPPSPVSTPSTPLS